MIKKIENISPSFFKQPLDTVIVEEEKHIKIDNFSELSKDNKNSNNNQTTIEKSNKKHSTEFDDLLKEEIRKLD